MKYVDKVQCINIKTKQIKYFNKDNIPCDYVVRKGSMIKTKSNKNSPTNKKSPVYWKTKYVNLLKYRIKNKLIEIDDIYIQQHHHIKPKSIYGENDYVILLTTFEHCLAHYYLRQMFKFNENHENFLKMNTAFISLYHFLGYDSTINSKRIFNFKKSQIEKEISK